MTNQIQIFENQEFGTIRTMSNEQGEVMFCGKDVAEALGYSNTKDALLRHVETEDKLGSRITTSGQSRTMTFINESGLYALILFVQARRCQAVQALGDQRSPAKHPQARRLHDGTTHGERHRELHPHGAEAKWIGW